MSFKNQILDQLIASNLSAFFVVVVIQSYKMDNVGVGTHAYRGIGLDATEEMTDRCCHCYPYYRRIEFNFYPLPTSPLFQFRFLLPSYLPCGSKWTSFSQNTTGAPAMGMERNVLCLGRECCQSMEVILH